MDSFKLTSWNIEHADKLIDKLDSGSDSTRRHAEARTAAIAAEISALEADILFVSEGPHGEARAAEFFDRVAPGYDLVRRPSGQDEDYGMRGGRGPAGRQWLWFLIRKEAPISGTLLHLDQWQALTEANSRGEHSAGKWQVSFPKWEKAGDAGEEHLGFSIPEVHQHWRHPQVLQATVDGAFVEVIGCHLKSKYNQLSPKGDPDDADFWEKNAELVAEIIKARVKITTECTDIRHYVDARFEADADAAMVICGDLNDGPGKERIERRFLYHDLIGSLQGDIFFARRFLNHALFDSPETERWSVHFEDRLDPRRKPQILLDHVLFSQAMTRSHIGQRFAYVARPSGGRVEHDVHHQVTAPRPKYAQTSDHKPVSMVFDRMITVPMG